MGFRCGLCSTPVEPGHRPNRLVVDVRDRVYARRPEANSYTALPDEGEKLGKRLKKDDPGGKGWEIAREVQACDECAGVGVKP